MIMRRTVKIWSLRSLSIAPWRAALLALVLAALFTQIGGQAATPPADSLPYRGGYLLPGDYVVADVDLKHGSGNFLTGTVPVVAVPANADIVAAWLYFEMITVDPNPGAHPNGPWHDVDINPSALGARFRDQPIPVGTAISQPLKNGLQACWPYGNNLKLTMVRADVLRLLPLQVDIHGTPTGNHLVNNKDLEKAKLAPNKVTMPGGGTTGVVPETAGVSLVIVYRDPSLPLRKIVLFDGNFIEPPPTAQNPNPTMSMTLRGFYKSSAVKNAQITHIGGSNPVNGERVSFNGVQIGNNVNPNPMASSSGRVWSSFSANVSSLMSRNVVSQMFGETATTSADHVKATPYDC